MKVFSDGHEGGEQEQCMVCLHALCNVPFPGKTFAVSQLCPDQTTHSPIPMPEGCTRTLAWQAVANLADPMILRLLSTGLILLPLPSWLIL